MKSVLLLLLSANLLACSKDEGVAADVSEKIILNQSYGNSASQKLDIYLPANRSSQTTPSIILIHGGGWTGGDKSASTQFVDTIQRRMPEYAVFNVNYRLAGNQSNLFPTQETDIKAVYEFIYNKRSEYGISDKFVLVGESAGGHLAMLQSYKYSAPVKPMAVVSFFGPSDMADMYNFPVNGNPLITYSILQVMGSTPTSNPALYHDSSPINFVTSSTGVPTILFHGSVDQLVDPSQSADVHTALGNANIASEFILYPGKDHGNDWGSDTFNDAFNRMQLFLETHVP